MAKKRKTVSGLENPKLYINAIARLNYAKGKKKGDRGYITPAQALNDFRKYGSVEAVESQIEKYKSDKEIQKLRRSYNYHMGYNTGDRGYMNTEAARYLGSELIDVVETAKQNYNAEIKHKREFNKAVKQSLADEQALKPLAKNVLTTISKASELNKKLMSAETESEYESMRAEFSEAITAYQDAFIELAKKERELKNKYRKKNKLPALSEEQDIERLRNLSIDDMLMQADNVLNGNKRKDKYGNLFSLYSMYHSQVTNTVSSVLDATMQTKIEVDGEEMLLSDVISAENVDNKKFWAAYHAWESDGGIVHAKDGRGYPNYITASRFFSGKEGNALLKNMLKSDYKQSNIKFLE
jgi:hypothetical protein